MLEILPVISVATDAVDVPVPLVPVAVVAIPELVNPMFDEVVPVSLPVI
jgi:hypothetical protein